MDTLTVLRILRIVLFALVAISLLLMAITKRAYWWQVLWALLVAVHALAFFSAVLIVEIRTGDTAPEWSQRWGAWLNVHMGAAWLIYLLVLRKMRKGRRNGESGGVDNSLIGSRWSARVRLARLAARQQREREWTRDERAFGRGERMA